MKKTKAKVLIKMKREIYEDLYQKGLIFISERTLSIQPLQLYGSISLKTFFIGITINKISINKLSTTEKTTDKPVKVKLHE